MTVNEKLGKLREKMKEHGMSAYIVPSGDAHLSEYVAEHYRFRAWISGFSGSAGTVVVTTDKSGLWTDGRYYIQAERELRGSEIVLFRAMEPGVKSFQQYLEEELPEGSTVGVSGKLFSGSAVSDMEKKFAKKGIKLNCEYDFSYDIWDDRPELPGKPLFCLDECYSGESTVHKLERLREKMKKAGGTQHVLNSLDSIMWLYNVRGGDVPNCPFAICYARVSLTDAVLYIDERQVPQEVRDALAKNGVSIRPYLAIFDDVAALGEEEVLVADESKTIYAILCAATTCQKKHVRDFVIPMKAVKNDVENENLKRCYLKDSAALVRTFRWIMETVGKAEITEYDVSVRLIEERAKEDLNIGPSFATIAGYGENAAMMHYMPTETKHVALKQEGMLLIDSGGQYLDGTTDITRTLVLGDLTPQQKRDFTLVLKGNIALISAKFLKGTTGANLDILARNPFWQVGLDYKCGTGHGVGFCLNVHEGPQNFSQNLNSVPLELGMNLTVEPGVYLEGRYGIRTENDVIVVPFQTTECGEFYQFDLLSYCPIDIHGIVPEMLTEDERTWINDYHTAVYEKLAPMLAEQDRAWLAEYTQAI